MANSKPARMVSVDTGAGTLLTNGSVSAPGMRLATSGTSSNVLGASASNVQTKVKHSWAEPLHSSNDEHGSKQLLITSIHESDFAAPLR